MNKLKERQEEQITKADQLYYLITRISSNL